MARLLPDPRPSLWLWSDNTGSQILRFAVVGAVNTLTDFALFSVLAFALGVNTILANTISYSTGVLTSYALNSRFTFQMEHRTWSSVLLFVLANLLSLLISTLTLVSFELVAPTVVAKVAAIVTASSFNFICARILLYEGPERRQAAIDQTSAMNDGARSSKSRFP